MGSDLSNYYDDMQVCLYDDEKVCSIPPIQVSVGSDIPRDFLRAPKA